MFKQVQIRVENNIYPIETILFTPSPFFDNLLNNTNFIEYNQEIIDLDITTKDWLSLVNFLNFLFIKTYVNYVNNPWNLDSDKNLSFDFYINIDLDLNYDIDNYNTDDNTDDNTHDNTHDDNTHDNTHDNYNIDNYNTDTHTHDNTDDNTNYNIYNYNTDNNIDNIDNSFNRGKNNNENNSYSSVKNNESTLEEYIIKLRWEEYYNLKNTLNRYLFGKLAVLLQQYEIQRLVYNSDKKNYQELVEGINLVSRSSVKEFLYKISSKDFEELNRISKINNYFYNKNYRKIILANTINRSKIRS